MWVPYLALVIMVTVPLSQPTLISVLLATAVVPAPTCHGQCLHDVILDHDGHRLLSRSGVLKEVDNTKMTQLVPVLECVALTGL